MIAIPGHTEGNIDVHLSEPGVRFAGDTIVELGGNVILGVSIGDAGKTLRATSKKLSV